MASASVILEGLPPGTNDAYHPTVIRAKGGKSHMSIGKSHRAKMYEKYALLKWSEPRVGRLPDAPCYRFDMEMIMPPVAGGSPNVRDWDGAVKLAQDAACKALGINDARIFVGHVTKCRAPKGAVQCHRITITPMEAEPVAPPELIRMKRST